MRPRDRFRNVRGDFLDRGLRKKAVVHRDEDTALVDKGLRLRVHLSLAPGLPAAAVDPDHDGMIRPGRRRVDVEDLALVLRFEVGDVAIHAGGGGEDRSGNKQQGEPVEGFHVVDFPTIDGNATSGRSNQEAFLPVGEPK